MQISFIRISAWDIPHAPFNFPDLNFRCNRMLLGAFETVFGLCRPSRFCLYPDSSDI